MSALLGPQLRDVVARVTERRGRAREHRADLSGDLGTVAETPVRGSGPVRRTRRGGLRHGGGAAATHFASTRPIGEGQVLAIYDLGGSTFDATVLRRTAQHSRSSAHPRGSSGWRHDLRRDRSRPHQPPRRRGGERTGPERSGDGPRPGPAAPGLHLAKEALSDDVEAIIPVFLPDRHFEVTLSRGELEGMIRAPIEATIGTLDRVIRAAGVDSSASATVLRWAARRDPDGGAPGLGGLRAADRRPARIPSPGGPGRRHPRSCSQHRGPPPPG